MVVGGLGMAKLHTAGAFFPVYTFQTALLYALHQRSWLFFHWFVWKVMFRSLLQDGWGQYHMLDGRRAAHCTAHPLCQAPLWYLGKYSPKTFIVSLWSRSQVSSDCQACDLFPSFLFTPFELLLQHALHHLLCHLPRAGCGVQMQGPTWLFFLNRYRSSSCLPYDNISMIGLDEFSVLMVGEWYPVICSMVAWHWSNLTFLDGTALFLNRYGFNVWWYFHNWA